MSHDKLLLQTIALELPSVNTSFTKDLCSLLAPLGMTVDDRLVFTQSNPDYTPAISLGIGDSTDARSIFTLSNSKKLTTNLINMTGLQKQSPHKYKKYSLEQVKKRLKGIKLVGLDHAGFNLPWFMGGTHPLISFLQTNLKQKSLYHAFPTGEAWDFILPGTAEEIHNESAIDYSQIRKPKFELVSFEKSSTPLIQLDITTNGTYSTIQERFPDGLHVDELKQTWVYITNPFAIDICLVLNEESSGDWSEHFALTRIQ